MSYRRALIILIALLVTASSAWSQSKRQAKVTPMSNSERTNITAVTRLATNDTCLGSPVDTITHIIQDWVIGNELYKNYIDPVRNGCNYPYTVTDINMPMYFTSGASFPVSVDIEAVDTTTVPGCHVPGQMLALSSDWDVTIPAGGGFFDIWIPLDSPLTVTGPFFAGFFLGAPIDPATGVAIAVDTTVLEECVSFNIWDTTIGFIDLVNNDIWNFPGQLVLYVTGYSTGGPLEPAPIAAFVNPTNNEWLYGQTELWVTDLAGSSILEYASFDYSDGGPWVAIGSDFDGTQPLRDGVNSTYLGSGFSTTWDFSGLPEGTYSLRATLVDSLGRSSQKLMLVHIEPTPPVPKIVSPDDYAHFCSPLNLIMTCSDENISSIQVEWKAASDDYSCGLTTLNQNLVGDVDGDPNDGNPAADGEFGEYYNAPVAAALAARLWFDRGYTSVMQEGAATLTTEQLSENLAAAMMTRENLGTYDDNFVLGLRQYFASHGNALLMDYRRNPDYLTLRKWVESEERSVVIGANGETGFWLAVDGFKGWPVGDSSTITVSVPMTGSLMDLPFRSAQGLNEILYNGQWHMIDLAVSMFASDWTVDRSIAGIDFVPADGWSVSWTPTGLIEGQKYFFRAWTEDADNHEGFSANLCEYNCSQVYLPGDFDGNNYADVADLTYLIAFVTEGGPPPVGGAERADTNCDNLINPADIVYFMNYLFGKNDPPCH